MAALPPNYTYRPLQEEEQTSFLVGLIMKLSRGKIANVQQAQFVLFIAALGMVLFTLILLWQSFQAPDKPTSKSIEEAEHGMPQLRNRR